MFLSLWSTSTSLLWLIPPFRDLLLEGLDAVILPFPPEHLGDVPHTDIDFPAGGRLLLGDWGLLLIVDLGRVVDDISDILDLI